METTIIMKLFEGNRLHVRAVLTHHKGYENDRRILCFCAKYLLTLQCFQNILHTLFMG